MQVYALGNLPGGHAAVPNAINTAGVVGGSGWPPSGEYAAILFNVLTGGTNLNLNASGGWSSVRGISDSGQIVGFEANDPLLAGRALLFDAPGGGSNINLGDAKRAYAINNNNQVVGGSGNGQSASAWLWDLSVGNVPMPLGDGEAVAISDSGIVVGQSYPVSGGNWHATLFDATGGGNNLDLGKLFSIDDRSFANGVNSSGQIVGQSGGPGAGYTATLFDISGSGQNMALGATGSSSAYAINAAGQIVGEENGHATLFDVTGSLNNLDLNDLVDPATGWVLENATGINDLGWIIGRGNHGAFLLAPDDAFPDYVPEPSSWLMGILCVCGLALADDCRQMRLRPS